MKQIVRIKSWEQMEKEYGLDSNNDIKCKYLFTKRMKYLCNTIIITTNSYITKGKEGWCISDDMIAEYLNPEDYPELFI